MDVCKVNQIFRGEVSSVQNYGAFIKIPGCPQQGLVHRSQVSSSHVEDVAEILQKGDRVWCKVISINEDGKIALSMKLVNQGNGKDLDPNGVQLHIDNQKRKSMGNKEEKKVIVLDAVFKTTCAKCKTPGHLARDCFSTPDGKKYELIPETDDDPLPPPQTVVENESKTKEKKHKSKKSKKRKKSKSSQRDVSDEESDSSDEKSKKKKKKSKESKRKKKKRHHSSSDSDSSDTDSSTDKKHSKKHKRSGVKQSD